MLALAAFLHGSLPARAIEIPHERYQLDNGMQVILHEDHSLPQVVVNLWYQVGSRDEEPGRSGFAHLFEHLMFMGTDRVPESQFDETMEAHGGWNNAWTSEDATDYYDVGPANLLETLIWLEADRLDGLAKAMTQEKLDLQRDVVRNELRQSVEDSPYGEVWQVLPTTLFPSGHPYAHPVIGSHEDLEAATLEDVVSFFHTWYVPNNASLVIAGDFDPDQARETVQRLFGHLEAGELPRRPTPPDTPKAEQPLVELTDQVNLPLTLQAWTTPAALKPGDATLDIIASLLASGRSSRLYMRMVHEDSIALEVDAGQYSQHLESLFLIDAKPAEGHTMEELEAAISEELERLADEGPTTAELERVVNQLEVDFLRNLESLQARASALNRYQALVGDPGWIDRDLARYHEVTAADVQHICRTHLSSARRAIIRVHPEDSP